MFPAIFSFLFHLVYSQQLIGLITSDYSIPSYVSSLTSNLEGLESVIKNSYGYSNSPEIIWVKVVLSDPSIPWFIPPEFLDLSIQVILDCTNFDIYSQYLSLQAVKQNFLHVVIGRPINTLDGEVPSANTLFTELSYISEAEALFDIIKTYAWQNLAVVYDETYNSIQLANYFKSLLVAPMSLLDEVILDQDDSSTFSTIYRRLESITRPSGARVVVVITDPILASILLQAADESVMGGAGYAWIFSTSAMTYIGSTSKNSNADVSAASFGVLKTGSIGIMAADQMGIAGDSLWNLEAVLYAICNAYAVLGKSTGAQLYSYIVGNPLSGALHPTIRFDATGVKTAPISLFNMQDFALTQVADWSASSRSFSFAGYQPIVWPGLGTTVPNDKVPIIKIGLLYPNTNKDGSLNADGQQAKIGFDAAISEINSDSSILGNYQLQPVYHDTMMSTSLAAATMQSLANLNIVGFVGPAAADLCQAYADASSSSANSKPIISYEASDSSLTDALQYPSFLRTIQPDGLQAVAVAMLINVKSWKIIGVLYTTDSLGQGIYASFQSNVETLDITLQNSESLRGIRVSFNSGGSVGQETKDDIDAALAEIVRNQIKIIVFLGNPLISLELAKSAYSKALYGPDYAWIGSIWITPSVLSELNTTYSADSANILQVLNGALGLAYLPASGASGTSFAAAYASLSPSPYTTSALLAYDTVYLLAYTLQSMIGQGEDINNGKDIINSLRAADFTGASGKVKFSEGTNDRSAYGYSIINVQNSELVTVMEYDPLNPNMFNYTGSIVWAGNAQEIPSDTWSTAYDCPFAANMSSLSTGGVAIVIVIGGVLFLLTLVLSLFSYRKWKQIDIVQITTPTVRSWKDTLVQIQILIEFFQFLAIAPVFQSLEIVVQAASNIFMLDIMKVAQSSKGDYWIMLGVVCALCYFWFFLVVLIMANAESWLKRVPLCQRLLTLMNTLYLPFYGNTMFLPALALLLDAFVCDHQAQGKSYVWRDCYMQCWGSEHRPYIIMSVIAILLYEPVAVFSRPLWQQAKTGLNIKIKPFFLLFKTCMQILLIAVGKSLQSITPLGHGVVFSILISAFTLVTYRLKPFNYNRCNLWEFSSLLAVSYMSILATLSNIGEATNIGWFVALMAGWILIGVGSVLFQRKYMPNMLVPSSENQQKKKLYDVLSYNKIGVYQEEEDNSRIEVAEVRVAQVELIQNDVQEVRVQHHNNDDVNDLDRGDNDDDAVPI